MVRILSIDIGYHNLALVVANCHDTNICVEYVEKVSLEDYKYIYSNDIVDLVPLMIERRKSIFDSVDQIIIERQPPGGFTNIEVLIHYIFKYKTSLISPNAMHSYFGFDNLNYEQRKERTEKIAQRYLEDNEYYMNLDRKHDIADAVCMLIYQNYINSMKYKKKKLEENLVFEEFAWFKPT